MKKYEIIYIVNTFLGDAARAKLIDSFHKVIADHEDTINKVDEWDVKESVCEISHMKKGYYVVVNVIVSNEGVHEPERLARINYSIICYTIIKTQDEG